MTARDMGMPLDDEVMIGRAGKSGELFFGTVSQKITGIFFWKGIGLYCRWRRLPGETVSQKRRRPCDCRGFGNSSKNIFGRRGMTYDGEGLV